MTPHADMQPRKVLGIDSDGFLWVRDKEGVQKFELEMLYGGGLRAIKPQPEDTTPDQVGDRRHRSIAEKMRGIDQA